MHSAPLISEHEFRVRSHHPNVTITYVAKPVTMKFFTQYRSAPNNSNLLNCFCLREKPLVSPLQACRHTDAWVNNELLTGRSTGARTVPRPSFSLPEVVVWPTYPRTNGERRRAFVPQLVTSESRKLALVLGSWKFSCSPLWTSFPQTSCK